MKIGILGAMDQEIALLKSSMANLESEKWKHLTFYTGELHGADVVLVKCGIGKVASALATTAMIEKFDPNYIINTGSAGGFDPNLNVGDLVIGSAVKHHDVDVTHFGYKPGQCAGMPEQYDCNLKLIEAAEEAAEEIGHFKHVRGAICTGDAFVGSDEAADRIKGAFPKAKAVEMEGAAIGQTCFMLRTPFLVIRSLSDIAGKSSSVSFQEYLDKASKHSAQLVMAMIPKLG